MAVNVTTAAASSAAGNSFLSSVCGWTSSVPLCLGTILPITLIFVAMLTVLVVSCRVTQQSEALEETVHMTESPLIPFSFKELDASTLKSVMECVMDLPLKTLLPRVDLEYLVEPCATMGVASVRDMLRLNTLALRDVGMGPKEQRIFSRALERRIRLRSKMHEVVSEITGRQEGTLKHAFEQAAKARRAKNRRDDASMTGTANHHHHRHPPRTLDAV